MDAGSTGGLAESGGDIVTKSEDDKWRRQRDENGDIL